MLSRAVCTPRISQLSLTRPKMAEEPQRFSLSREMLKPVVAEFTDERFVLDSGDNRVHVTGTP